MMNFKFCFRPKAMVVDRGFTRSSTITVTNILRITPEIIEHDCIECGGDGDWGKFIFEGEGCEAYAEAMEVKLPYVRGSYPCVECKGTGRTFA